MKLAKYILASFVTYFATIPISNIAYSLVASIFVFYLSMHFLNRYLDM